MLSRQHFLILGVMIILIGVQLRFVQSYVLTPRATQFIEAKIKKASLQTVDSYDPYDHFLIEAAPHEQRSFTPPRWLGWAMISVGAVLMLHGITIRKD